MSEWDLLSICDGCGYFYFDIFGRASCFLTECIVLEDPERPIGMEGVAE